MQITQNTDGSYSAMTDKRDVIAEGTWLEALLTAGEMAEAKDKAQGVTTD
jgi:hypothetical protein